MDPQTVTAIIASAVPTLAVLATFLRNESAIGGLNKRIDDSHRRIDETNKSIDDTNKRIETLTRDMNARFETLTRDMNYRFETLIRRFDKVDEDLREWAKITMQRHLGD
jgi:archaellum component FlaC